MNERSNRFYQTLHSVAPRKLWGSLGASKNKWIQNCLGLLLGMLLGGPVLAYDYQLWTSGTPLPGSDYAGTSYTVKLKKNYSLAFPVDSSCNKAAQVNYGGGCIGTSHAVNAGGGSRTSTGDGPGTWQRAYISSGCNWVELVAGFQLKLDATQGCTVTGYTKNNCNNCDATGGSQPSPGSYTINLKQRAVWSNLPYLSGFSTAVYSIAAAAYGKAAAVTADPKVADTGTAATGATVSFTSLTPAVCTVTGTTVTNAALAADSTCTIRATAAAHAGNKLETGYTDYSWAVSKKLPQVINFPAQPSPQSYATLPATFEVDPLASGGASGNTVVYGSLTPAVCTVSGTTVSIVSTGTCTLTADQAGDATYGAAEQVTRNVTIKRQLLINFPTQTQTSRLFVLNQVFSIDPLATSNAYPNAITYSSLNNAVCTVSGTSVTMKSVGICKIAANQAGDATFEAATQETQSVELTKALQYIVVTTHAPGTKINGGTFTVSAESRAKSTNALTHLPVQIQGIGSCSGSGSVTDSAGSVTITMTSSTGICTVLFTQAGDSNYEMADPITEYTLPDTTGGSGCFGEGTYTSLQFTNTGGYIGWACNDGSLPGGPNVSCNPPVWWNVWPIYQSGWSIGPGSGLKGHVLQTSLNPGKSFKIQKAPGGGDFYNILNVTDQTCLASGDAVYEIGGSRKGANASAGYLIAFRDTATMPGAYCDYSHAQTKWKMHIQGSFATFETAGYPSWPSHGCIGSESSAGLRNRLIAPGDGNFGHWGDSWVRNAAPSCNSSGARIKCGGYQPPPPNHIRFEFDSDKTYVCQAAVTIKMCTNDAPALGSAGTCSPYPGYAVLKPVVSKGTWSGLTLPPLTGFTGSSTGVYLSHDTVGGTAVSLSYSSPSMTLADTALECYDTATDQRVDCSAAFTYKTCPPFDAVEKGAPIASNLYTKLAGEDFEFDAMTGNAAYTGRAKIELVDVSSAQACDSPLPAALAGVSFSVPSVSIGSNTYNYVAGDLGRKTFKANYDNAVGKVAVRVIELDKGNKCTASTDTFTIRPTKLSLTTTLPASPATATAGLDFSISATAKTSTGANATGYAGVTPVLDDRYVYDWDNASISGLLAGHFASAAAGVATGTAFKFSGVGEVHFVDYKTDARVMFHASSVGDVTFTTLSGDQAKGDCIAGSFDDASVLVGGLKKYGCNIGSTALDLPRFIPDHYEVDNRLSSRCGGSGPDLLGGMTYFGQAFRLPPTAWVAAVGADGSVLKNLNTGSGYASMPSFTVEAVDNNVVKFSPATADADPGAPVVPFMDLTPFAFTSGEYTNIASGTVSRIAPQNFEKFGLKTTVTDPDGILIKKCDGAAHSATSCSTATTVKLRFGILKLDNAYGPETLPLHVPVRALYWDGAKWALNTQDSCTVLNTRTNDPLSTPNDPSSNLVIANYKGGGLAAGNIVINAASTTLAGGKASIRIEAPGAGVHGSADAVLNLSGVNALTTGGMGNSCALNGSSATGANFSYLLGKWCGSAYDKNPHATIRFGAPKNQFLYMRERY